MRNARTAIAVIVLVNNVSLITGIDVRILRLNRKKLSHVSENDLQITNNYNLPESIYKALATDSYKKGDGDYSVTEILQPPQLCQLKRRHSEELSEEAMDRCWSLFGSAVHHILEKASPSGSLSEERLYVECLDRKIGGQVDCYHNGVIEDFKVTSAWTLVYGSRVKEWEEQLNLYAYIFRQNGYTVDKLQIIAILRDWDKNRALADGKYPQTPIQVIPLTLWTEGEQLQFLHRKMLVHIGAEDIPDEDLSIGFRCMPDEMWEQPNKWAVMKEGRKSAVRVFDTEEDAWQHMNEAKYEDARYMSVVKRPGKRTRCSDFCSVRDYCQQYKDYLKGNS